MELVEVLTYCVAIQFVLLFVLFVRVGDLTRWRDQHDNNASGRREH